ncbi:MAG TPA: hypothetical protein ENJ95_02675 [Bacteroidetes bacterium]|nr:hypothetical protein [Bacteroidota bacterium]
MRQIVTFFILIIFVKTISAQATTDLAIGKWKQHLPFNAGIYVTQSNDQIFYATGEALLIIDKADRALERMTKVEGLSDVGVELVKYSKGSEVLLVAFDNGVIDLLSGSGNKTLNGVPESSIILGQKKINDVFMGNDSIAYIAGNFGITTLNVRTGLFPNTIRTPLEARAAVIYKNSIYVSTEEGLYTIALDSPANLDDFSNWEYLAGANNFPGIYDAGAMMVFNDRLYLSLNDSLFMYDGNQASFVHFEEGHSINFLSADGPHLIAGFECTGGCLGKVLIFDSNNGFTLPANNCVKLPRYAVEDETGSIWFADLTSGYKVEAPGDNACAVIDVKGIRTLNAYGIAIGNGQVWIASGGLNNNFAPLFLTDGFSSLIDGEWRQYSILNEPALAGLSDFLDIEIHPENGKIYTSAFIEALVEYDPLTDEFKVFDSSNSCLQRSTEGVNRHRTAGLAFDKENTLWVCNHTAPRPLVAFYDDGSCKNFSLDCVAERGFIDIVVDDFGNKWLFTTDRATGVVVFNEGDKDVAGDDRCVVLNASSTVLPSNEISSIEVDREGAVWVGTKLGAAVFQCDPFDPNCAGSLPFVEVDGFGANLLEDQDVTAIAVDGANRKWFGTRTGLFVMSPEGSEQIAKFTKENSPLFDNIITDIAFNNETGEVYIGTARGIISYRSDAVMGGSRHKSNVLVFPNPVRPEYDGPIAINGLAKDATVKITDVSGQLVFETDALGGQAIWDGRDYNDRKVNTGVYLVFATSGSSTNPDIAVAKILVVN